jgi:hypothetical protein
MATRSAGPVETAFFMVKSLFTAVEDLPRDVGSATEWNNGCQ